MGVVFGMVSAVPEESEELIDKLTRAAEYMSQFDFHAETFDDADVTPGDIESIEDFRQLPTMDSKDLADDFIENPPWGTLVSDGRSVVRCNFTPSAHMDSMPVLWTQADIDIVRRHTVAALRDAGITDEDTVLNTGGLAGAPFGWAVADAVEGIGATHIPAGPGDAERKAEIIQNNRVTAVIGFPSFLEKIARTSDDTLDAVDIVIGSGEPFTAIDGYRERVREAFGGAATVVDGYGLAELGGGWVSMGTSDENGMKLLTDRIFPEVVDPETGELVEQGEKGELVLTTLDEESAPLLRFKTGDLTVMSESDGEYLLPDGVFGRTDDRKKVKGMKIYPSELQMHLAGFDGIDPRNIQLHITRPEGETDRLGITVNGGPSTDREELGSEIESVLGISVDQLEVSEDFEVPDGELVIDDR